MELRDIEYFAAIDEHGHLGRAAEAVHLTQPALSKSLRRLEHAVGAKLVKRTSTSRICLKKALEENGIFGPRIAVKTSHLPLRDHVVASSDLLGVSSRRVLRHIADRLDLAELPVPELTRGVAVAYRKNAYRVGSTLKHRPLKAGSSCTFDPQSWVVRPWVEICRLGRDFRSQQNSSVTTQRVENTHFYGFPGYVWTNDALLADEIRT